ncbi:chloramphenicol phosphotransferase [Veronia nyctiphanis]|uniref:Chloramphenicol phosphotransferase n=1 Tax=Veronia nyctiphanis TaxID=1278244 RepID=A0A4Q0YGQ1_9GAMM|nr:AAA family ATPase [Veronia nyctiphanis]RXJ69463.1 chloramphenicol phosphotransferase [Veronia nyctiphanis]
MDVIYLNGPSGSGKTSLARALQDTLPNYYLHIGIDTFINMMPTKANCWDGTGPAEGFSWRSVDLPEGKKGMRVQSGEYGASVNDAFHACVLALLQSGQKLIIDDVADGKREVDRWLEELQPYSVFSVGLQCSIASLEHRERIRGDRVIGSSVEQYYRVHSGVNYDLIIDTDKHSAQQGAKIIATKIHN